MSFIDLVKSARTTRRFKPVEIGDTTLNTLVDCARFSPSGANQQRLKFMIVKDASEREKVFPLIKWAGALKDWEGPAEGERPMAYIVLLLDKNIGASAGIDHGIAAQSIMLGARDAGLGCCMIGAYNPKELDRLLELPDHLESVLILALGEPDEDVIIEDHISGESIVYYRDEEGGHHVPKRTREELIWP